MINRPKGIDEKGSVEGGVGETEQEMQAGVW